MTTESFSEVLESMISDFNSACENEGHFKKYRRPLIIAGGIATHVGITYLVQNCFFPDATSTRAVIFKGISYLNPVSMFFGVIGVAEFYSGIFGSSVSPKQNVSFDYISSKSNIAIDYIKNELDVNVNINVKQSISFSSLDEMIEKLKGHPFCENIQKYSSYYLEDLSFDELHNRIGFLANYSDAKYKAFFDEIGKNCYKYKEIKDILTLFNGKSNL